MVRLVDQSNEEGASQALPSSCKLTGQGGDLGLSGGVSEEHKGPACYSNRILSHGNRSGGYISPSRMHRHRVCILNEGDCFLNTIPHKCLKHLYQEDSDLKSFCENFLLVI